MNVTIETIDLTTISSEMKGWIDSVSNTSSHGTVFHTVEWNRLFIEEFALQNITLLARQNDKPIGFYTFYVTREADTERSYSPYTRYYSFYGAPIVVPGYEDAISKLLMASERMIKGGVFSILTAPNYPKEPLAAARYKCSESFTCVINLQKTEDELFKSIKPSARKAIRKAVRSGVHVTEGTFRDFLGFYEMYRSFYDKINQKVSTKLFILPERFCWRVWEEFSRRDKAFLLIGRLGNEVVNSVMSLCYKDTIYAWVMGTRLEYRQYNIENLLFWEAREMGKKSWLPFIGSL